MTAEFLTTRRRRGDIPSFPLSGELLLSPRCPFVLAESVTGQNVGDRLAQIGASLEQIGVDRLTWPPQFSTVAILPRDNRNIACVLLINHETGDMTTRQLLWLDGSIPSDYLNYGLGVLCHYGVLTQKEARRLFRDHHQAFDQIQTAGRINVLNPAKREAFPAETLLFLKPDSSFKELYLEVCRLNNLRRRLAPAELLILEEEASQVVYLVLTPARFEKNPGAIPLLSLPSSRFESKLPWFINALKYLHATGILTAEESRKIRRSVKN